MVHWNLMPKLTFFVIFIDKIVHNFTVCHLSVIYHNMKIIDSFYVKQIQSITYINMNLDSLQLNIVKCWLCSAAVLHLY